MKRIHFLLSAALLLLPVTASASIFDVFYDEARDARLGAMPEKAVVEFIIEEMKHWNGSGIIITEADIAAALNWQLFADPTGDGGLCTGKKDSNGQPINFIVGGQSEGEGCIGLRQAIVSLVLAEQEASQLGTDLLAISNGSELSIADEPHRPVLMGTISLLVKRVWSGTGVAMIPWDGTADAQVDELNGKLAALSTEDLDKAVARYHFGHFRDKRENDPRFQSPALNEIGDKLEAIAGKLHITGEPTKVGEYAVPRLLVPNVGLWARGDDIGIMYLLPDRFIRNSVKQAGDYPEIKPSPSGDTLAYPFEYEGSAVINNPLVASPLCSRTVGRFGYLCRPVPETSENCTTSYPSKITLVQCSKTVKQTGSGPSVCEGLNNIYKDDGTPLEDPNNPGRLNPALTPAEARTICDPDNKVIYQDDIGAHACYIGQCLALSMSGHSLIPNRSPVVINESTSPYQSCMRADPQLGLYTEAVTSSPFPLPTYLGHLLVPEFEHLFCQKNGRPGLPVVGDCTYKTDQTANETPLLQSLGVTAMLENAEAVATDQDAFLELGTVIGQRAALGQAVIIERKLYAGVTQFVLQMASLFKELKRAPLTDVACPWTGPFLDVGR